MLSEATIEELRKIIAEDYGRDLTLAQAEDVANALVRYFDLLAKIKHREIQNVEENKLLII